MPALAVQVTQPADNAVVIGAATTRLLATLAQPAPVPLFFKWYSSAAPDPVGTALDMPAVALPLGSQLITFSAKDQALDTAAALQAVVHAGMAGGPPVPGAPAGSPPPCRVHVLRAAILDIASGANLNRANATLACEAPPRWARKIPPAVAYELDPDYHAQNKLRFRWRFVPSGAPAGRNGGEFAPTPQQWAYVPPANNNDKPRLRYSGALPAGLGTGNYILTLRVEHADQPAQGHEQSLSVVLI
jgi:hypothetical protein